MKGQWKTFKGIFILHTWHVHRLSKKKKKKKLTCTNHFQTRDTILFESFEILTHGIAWVEVSIIIITSR